MKVSALPSYSDDYDTRNARSLVVTNRHASSDLRSPSILTIFLNRDSHRCPLGTGSSANFYLLILEHRMHPHLHQVFLFEYRLQYHL